MELPPLTHLDVLERVAPFARHGYELDLAASVRAERRLVFRPREADGVASGNAAVRLQFEDLGPGRLRLLRTARHASGAEATLRAAGASLDALLARFGSFPVQRHFATGPGFVVARHYVDEGTPVLTRGTVHLAGLELTLNVPRVGGLAGELVLLPAPAGAPRPALPEDLLAVLGWTWARLVPDRRGWTSRVRLRARGPDRTERAEALLDRVAAHLAQTLAEAPARYHARWRAARWAVFFRRGIPSLTALALVAAVLVSSRFDLQLSTTTLVLLYHVPTAIIAASFMLQELPRFELPPWPRPLPGDRWGDRPPAVSAAS